MTASALDARTMVAGCEVARAALDACVDHDEAVAAALDALRMHVGPELLVTSVVVLEHDRLWILAQRGYDRVFDGQRLDEGVMARAVSSGELQFLPDVEADSAYLSAIPGIRSEIAIPFGGGPPALGVLNIESVERALTPACVEPLTRLAAATGDRVVARLSDGAPSLSSLAPLLVHFSSLRDTRSIAELAARSLGRQLELDSAQLMLLDEHGKLRLTGFWRKPDSALEAVDAEYLARLAGMVETQATYNVLDPAVVRPPGGCEDPRQTIVWIPLRVRGEQIGLVVGAACRRLAEPGRHEGEVTTLLAVHTAASLDAVAVLEGERKAAMTDPLTGLGNHRAFQRALQDSLRRAVETRASVSLAVFDLDDFKLINDSFGHLEGDRVLQHVARRGQGYLRREDGLFRVGGEEFAVLLPGAGPPQALAVLERLEEHLTIERRSDQRLPSLSGGVATFPTHAQSRDELVHKADLAMYAAKRAGKRRCIIYGENTQGASGRANTQVARDDLYVSMRNPAIRSQLFRELAEVSAAVDALAGEGNAARLLSSLAYRLTLLLGGTGCTVSRLDGLEVRDHASFAHEPYDLDTEEPYDVSDHPQAEAVLTRREPYSCTVDDAAEDPAAREFLREIGMQSLLMLPLVAGEEVWGLVEIYDVMPRRFADADVSLAQLVTGQAGMTIARLRMARDVERVYRDTLGSLATALEAKDPATSRHTNAIAELAMATAERLDCPPDEVKAVELGALLHDIGKIKVPESILNKPGPLTEEEWAIMRRHTEIGEGILRPIASLAAVRPLVRSSHERWDGGGYPDGLAGEDIPLGARIIAVCDSYHAMIEDRPYRLALPCSVACAELLRVAGAQLDPRCVDAFLELLAERERSATAVIHYWPEREGSALNGGASSSQRAAAS